MVYVSNTEQYALLEEIHHRRRLAFNRFREDPDDRCAPLQLIFKDKESFRDVIFYDMGLHNKDMMCEDFYETDWAMFIDNDTIVRDLFFSLKGWFLDGSQFYRELSYDDPFLKELLQLARIKWPCYDGDDGRKDTVDILIKEKIGTVLWNEFDLVFSEKEREAFAEMRKEKKEPDL